MFRKLLRSIMIALPVFGGIVDSRAETLPQGCFVSDAARIVWNYPPCFNQGRNSYLAVNPLNGFSAEEIYSFYGYQYGFEVVASTAFFTKWQDAETASAQNKQASDTHYSWYVTQFEKNKKNKSVELKLRKACGSKCKRIKSASSMFASSGDNSLRNALQTTDPSPDRSLSYEEYRNKISN
jgi:hypothetical protein